MSGFFIFCFEVINGDGDIGGVWEQCDQILNCVTSEKFEFWKDFCWGWGLDPATPGSRGKKPGCSCQIVNPAYHCLVLLLRCMCV